MTVWIVLVYVVIELLLPTSLSNECYSKGMLNWYSVLAYGEYYRLLTCMFLHLGSAHLMNNMLVFFAIGSRLEQDLGRVRFLIVYFVSGILAGVASMGYNYLQGQAVSSAGASGAIFGVVGAMFWVVLINRGRVQGLSVRQMLVFVVLSLYGGFVDQHTDNAAHIGGFIAGFLLAMLLYRRRKTERAWVEI